MNVRYRVTLSDPERARLEELVTKGCPGVREVKRAQLLLAVADGVPEAQIVKAVRTSAATIYRTKQAFVEEGLEVALHDTQRPGGARKLSGKEEALLVATACSAPPEGRARWTLELLSEQMIFLTAHATLSRATVGRRLAEQKVKPWQQKMWCVPTINSEYVARMEDVLDLYAEPADPQRPVLSFDESPTQLIGEAREPQPVSPGAPARVDYEYVRHGTANLFVVLDVHGGWRHVDVTEQRTSKQFAHQMKELVDVHYPRADCLRIVMDNLSTHSLAALYDTFEPSEARRLARKLEIHYVPKHASWLNMVEIEIGVLKAQCLARRIPERGMLVREIAAWELRRNEAKARVVWTFTTERAREKLGRIYRPLATEHEAEETKACEGAAQKAAA